MDKGMHLMTDQSRVVNHRYKKSLHNYKCDKEICRVQDNRAIGIKPWEDSEIFVQSTDEVTDFRNSSAYGYEKEGLFYDSQSLHALKACWRSLVLGVIERLDTHIRISRRNNSDMSVRPPYVLNSFMPPSPFF